MMYETTPRRLRERMLSAETSLLLTACRAALGQNCKGALCATAAEVADWDVVLAAAQRHAVVPLLHRALNGPSAAVVPPHVAHELQQLFERNVLRNLALTGHLVALLDEFECAGVPVLPIKGPLLAISAYGDVTMRAFLDLDIVVRVCDRGRALAVLHDAGYRVTLPIEGGAQTALLAADYHLQLVHDDHAVALELHWALGRGYGRGYLSGSWAWRNACTIPVLGRVLHSLSPQALLVYLCAHGAKHMWSQLNWICDVAALLHSGSPMSGEEILALARATGTWRMVRLGIVLASELLSAELPSNLPQGWDDDLAVNKLAERAVGLLFEPGASHDGNAVLSFQLAVRDGWRDRLGLWTHVLVSPRVADVTAISLPPALHSLYHALRPLRLLSKHSRKWVGRTEAKWRR